MSIMSAFSTISTSAALQHHGKLRDERTQRGIAIWSVCLLQFNLNKSSGIQRRGAMAAVVVRSFLIFGRWVLC
jgi:hypothetical protein